MTLSAYEIARRRDPVGMARAAAANRRQARVNAAVKRLTPLVGQMEADLRLQMHAARIAGDHARLRLLEAELDALRDTLADIARNLAEDLR